MSTQNQPFVPIILVHGRWIHVKTAWGHILQSPPWIAIAMKAMKQEGVHFGVQHSRSHSFANLARKIGTRKGKEIKHLADCVAPTMQNLQLLALDQQVAPVQKVCTWCGRARMKRNPWNAPGRLAILSIALLVLLDITAWMRSVIGAKKGRGRKRTLNQRKIVYAAQATS
jgi:hypothetical protein